MKIWSMIPLLRYEEGHPYQYNLAFGKACELNGWEHGALIPTSCLIEGMPVSWLKVLAADYFTDKGCKIICKTPVQKLKSMLRGVFPLCKALRQISKENKNSVLFLEQFFLAQFLTWFLALVLTRSTMEFWILHRYSPENMPLKGTAYQLAHKVLKMWLGKNKVKMFTDSVLLGKEYEKFFKCPVRLLPIPHAEDGDVKPFERADSKKLLWWPGGFTLPSKGLKHIKHLVESKINQESFNWKLVVADSARNELSEAKMDILYISSHLSRADYMKWMKTVDIVLLPYDPQVYRSATSGIFVEAVIAGATPLVQSGTWMAAELEHYKLGRLIIDWNREPFLERIEEIFKNSDWIEHLNHMRKTYQTIHSLPHFAKCLREAQSS